MDGDLSLFGDDEPVRKAPPEVAPTPIAAWQINLLRKALDARSLESMDERQKLIEDIVGRPVASLRDLTHEEAMRALAGLGGSAPQQAAGASAWDERDEDTWIDRL